MIKVPDVETKFVIKNKELIKYYQKYAMLRPSNIVTRQFFVSYQKGKCTKRPVRIKTLLIGKYFQLPNHSFRRTSAAFQVEMVSLV